MELNLKYGHYITLYGTSEQKNNNKICGLLSAFGLKIY